MTVDDYAILRRSVQLHESLRLHPYPDTTGHLTIGYGHNLANGIPRGAADVILDFDLAEAIAYCHRDYAWYDALDGPRQRVLAELMFEMGPSRLSGFRLMLAAAEAGHYTQARTEMLRSDWAKEVGSARAADLAAEWDA